MKNPQISPGSTTVTDSGTDRSLPEITEQESAGLSSWFAGYVSGFRLESEEWQRNITLKAEHSQRVAAEIVGLGTALGLSEAELRLARIIALLHDVGRFEQYARYRTFKDGKSENHAALGVKILEETGALDHLAQDLRQIILAAVLNHNRASLPRIDDSQVLFYSRLVRDADKLDIYRVLTDYYRHSGGRRNSAIELDLPDTTGVSEPVCRDLLHHRAVDFRNVRNLNDFKLLQVGWVFDINFPPTLNLLRERRYLEILQQALPTSDPINRIFSEVHTYLGEGDAVEMLIAPK